MTFAQVEAAWLAAGGSQALAPVMAAIAAAESGLNPDVPTNYGTPNHPEQSVGLWQINILAHPQYAGWNLNDPVQNAKAAVQIAADSGLNAWTTYSSGAYKAYLADAQAAAGGIASSVGSALPTVGLSPSVYGTAFIIIAIALLLIGLSVWSPSGTIDAGAPIRQRVKLSADVERTRAIAQAKEPSVAEREHRETIEAEKTEQARRGHLKALAGTRSEREKTKRYYT